EEEQGGRGVDDEGVAAEENLAAEKRPIELARSVLIGDHEKMREHETFLRRGKIERAHRTPPIVVEPDGRKCSRRRVCTFAVWVSARAAARRDRTRAASRPASSRLQAGR